MLYLSDPKPLLKNIEKKNKSILEIDWMSGEKLIPKVKINLSYDTIPYSKSIISQNVN